MDRSSRDDDGSCGSHFLQKALKRNGCPGSLEPYFKKGKQNMRLFFFFFPKYRKTILYLCNYLRKKEVIDQVAVGRGE
jgi:hypothetical protein